MSTFSCSLGRDLSLDTRYTFNVCVYDIDPFEKIRVIKGAKKERIDHSDASRLCTILCTEQSDNKYLEKFVSSRSVIVRSARDASISLPPPFFLYSPSLLLSCPTVTRGFRSRSKNGSVGLTLMRFLHGMKRFRGGYARLVCHIYNPLWP